MKTKYFLIGALFGLLLICLIVVIRLRFPVLTPANTFLAQKNYSNLTRAQVFEKLSQDFVFPVNIPLSASDFYLTLSSSSISATLNQSLTASQLTPPIIELNLVDVVKKQFSPSSTAANFSLIINHDDLALNTFIASLSAQFEKPYIPTELVVVKNNISVKEGQLGQKLNTVLLHDLIINSLKLWQIDQKINLPLEPVGQLPSDDLIASALSKAQSLLGKQITLIADEQKVVIDSTTLISWLDFSTSLNQTKINDFSTLTATNLKKDPVNAIFKFENNKVLEFRPAASGVTFDPKIITQSIVSQFNELYTADLKNLDITLTPDYQLPSIKTADVNDLGIKELLGRGTSTFKHSSAIRNMNIEKGASIINRVLVAPGEEFSFLKSLGEVTLEAGFKKAYIIRQGKTELDVGGGVCQVSTTFFRAMLNSGVNITHRMHHAYRVSYYEEDMPPGYDATVFIPSPDLKFINDTGHHILIQNTYDGVKKILTYEFYGTSDGRIVDISNYRQWGSTPAPPDRWIDDPTLEPGKVVQDERRIAGLKTAFDWTVTRQGEVIRQKTFQSNFVPWAAVYRRGPAL